MHVYTQMRGHVDCDAFFASCHAAHNPSLRTKHIVVWDDIVIARSYSTKQYGITIGTPIREAKKLLPDETEYISPTYRLYRALSERFITLLKQHVDQCEQFSIDEAFFSPLNTHPDSAVQTHILRHLQATIKQIIGIPVSIGLGPTRILAKIFSDYKKPNGLCVWIEPHTVHTILKQLPIHAIPFIGTQTQKKLAWYCRSAYDLASLSYESVKQMLWHNWMTIRRELNGISAKSFQPHNNPRSISKSYSFNHHTTNQPTTLRHHLITNIQRARDQLVYQTMKTQKITIFFRTVWFDRWSAETILTHATQDRPTIIKACRTLFESIDRSSTYYRTTWVRFSLLEPIHKKQPSLFELPNTTQYKHTLNTTIAHLKEQYWTDIIWSASSY